MARPKFNFPTSTNPDDPAWVKMTLDFDDPLELYSEKYQNNSYGYSITIDGEEWFWYATEAANRSITALDPLPRRGDTMQVLKTGEGTSTRWFAKMEGAVQKPPAARSQANPNGSAAPASSATVYQSSKSPQTKSSYSPPDMDSLLRLADYELDKLVAIMQLVKVRPEFGDVSNDQLVRSATTALIAAGRAYYPGITFTSDLSDEDLFLDLVTRGYDGSNLVEAVMKAALIYTDNYDDMNDMIEYLKQVGLSREFITEDKESWTGLFKIAKRIGEMIGSDGFDPDIIVEEFNLSTSPF